MHTIESITLMPLKPKTTNIWVLLSALHTNFILAMENSINTTDSILAKNIEITKGEAFFSAREKIIKSGWKPIKTYSKFEDGELENEFGEAFTYKQKNYLEIESCSGTGEQYCIFNYQKNNACLKIVTQGLYDPETNSPIVIRWENIDCKKLITK